MNKIKNLIQKLFYVPTGEIKMEKSAAKIAYGAIAICVTIALRISVFGVASTPVFWRIVGGIVCLAGIVAGVIVLFAGIVGLALVSANRSSPSRFEHITKPADDIFRYLHDCDKACTEIIFIHNGSTHTMGILGDDCCPEESTYFLDKEEFATFDDFMKLALLDGVRLCDLMCGLEVAQVDFDDPKARLI